MRANIKMCLFIKKTIIIFIIMQFLQCSLDYKPSWHSHSPQKNFLYSPARFLYSSDIFFCFQACYLIFQEKIKKKNLLYLNRDSSNLHFLNFLSINFLQCKHQYKTILNISDSLHCSKDKVQTFYFIFSLWCFLMPTINLFSETVHNLIVLDLYYNHFQLYFYSLTN